MEKKQKNSKKTAVIAIAFFAILIIVFGAVYFTRRAQAGTGSKDYTVIVVNAAGQETSYKAETNQEYLQGAMDELAKNEGLSYSGIKQSAGYMIQEINGDRAVYEESGSYWAMYVNDEYGQYGINAQPVTSGDIYKFCIESM